MAVYDYESKLLEEKELEAALEIIEKLDEKSCGERKD